MFGIFLGPVGWFIAAVIAFRVVFNRDRMDDSSPRELLEGIIGSGPVVAIGVILFLGLTAVSILGGVIVFAYILLFIGLMKIFLPGANPFRKSAPTYIPSTTSSSSSYDDSSSSSRDDRDHEYDNYRDDDRDDDNDDDDDNDKGGSIWDGWLIKY